MSKKLTDYLPTDAKPSLGHINPEILNNVTDKKSLIRQMANDLKIDIDLLNFTDVQFYNLILICRNDVQTVLKEDIENDNIDIEIFKKAVETGDVKIVREYMKIIHKYQKEYFVARLSDFHDLMEKAIKNYPCLIEYLIPLSPHPFTAFMYISEIAGSLNPSLFKIYINDYYNGYTNYWERDAVYDNSFNQPEVIKIIFATTPKHYLSTLRNNYIISINKHDFSFSEKETFKHLIESLYELYKE